MTCSINLITHHSCRTLAYLGRCMHLKTCHVETKRLIFSLQNTAVILINKPERYATHRSSSTWHESHLLVECWISENRRVPSGSSYFNLSLRPLSPLPAWYQRAVVIDWRIGQVVSWGLGNGEGGSIIMAAKGGKVLPDQYDSMNTAYMIAQ